MMWASSWWSPMRIEGRRPRARVDALMVGDFVISRIIASTFFTMSECSDCSGSLIVGMRSLPASDECAASLEVMAGGRGPNRALSTYYPPYAYGRRYEKTPPRGPG